MKRIDLISFDPCKDLEKKMQRSLRIRDLKDPVRSSEILQDLCQNLRFYKIFGNLNDDLGRLSWKFTKILIQIFNDV